MRSKGRFAWRALWLAGELVLLGGRFLFLYLFTLGRPSLGQRARCLSYGCRRTAGVFIKRIEVIGPVPKTGLLVSNHLSYLDISLLGTLAPAIFVSKAEVKAWPVFGWFASLGGTVFVERSRRGVVGEIGSQIAERLAQGHLVVLFPEGTSSGGETVLPFKSSLLEPVAGGAHAVTAGCIRYSMADGVVSEDVCYWGDMVFGPHIVKLLSKPRFQARVSFHEVATPSADRKELARQLQAEVTALHGAGVGF